MKFTEAKAGAINRKHWDLVHNKRGIGHNHHIQVTTEMDVTANGNYICDLSDLSEVIKKLLLLKVAVKETTGIEV